MKKVLIITYYWPPAGGPGVQRVLKFAKYLPKFGWEPIILTVESGEYPAVDQTMNQDILKNLKIYRTKSLDPTSLYKKLLRKSEDDHVPTFIMNPSESDSIFSKFSKWIRANFFIPDAKIGWFPAAVRKGLEIIKNEKIDIIFSSSPPHTVQLIAKRLAHKSGLNWVADFRDPWRDAFWQIEMKRGKWAIKKDETLEKSVLSKADSVVTISPSLIEIFKQKKDNSYYLIPNGFDTTDFQDSKHKPGDTFRITYLGTLGKDQKIDNFLHALNILIQNSQNKLTVNFYGNFHESIKKSIIDANLSQIISIHPYISHEKAIDVMVNSELLLLVIPDVPENCGIVTGKIYEYLATQNYILGIGPEDGDAAEILAKTRCGKMFGYSEDLTPILQNRLTNWLNGDYLNIDRIEIDKYSREQQTKMLAEVFEGTTA